MSVSYRLPLLFWLPSQRPCALSSPPDRAMAPMSLGFLSVSYPSLTPAIRNIVPLMGDYADRLTNMLEGELNTQIKPYLICRMMFFLMMLVCVFYAILNIVVYKVIISFIINLVVLFLWMVLTRLVMNAMGAAMSDYQSVYKSRLVTLIRNILGTQDVVLEPGIGMGWIEVYRNQYQPPAQASEIAMGIAV